MRGYKDEPYKDENEPPPLIEAPAYVNGLHLNAQMYGIADKYDIPSLKEEAAEMFDAAILEMKENESMKRHTGAILLDEMMEAIPCIYSSKPDGDRRLRDRAVEVMHPQQREVRRHPGLKCLIAEVPEFLREAWPSILSTRFDNDCPFVKCFTKISSLTAENMMASLLGGYL